MDAFDVKTEATRLTVECWRLSSVKAVAKNWTSHVVSNHPDQAFFLSSASIWPLGLSASPFCIPVWNSCLISCNGKRFVFQQMICL